jgi:S-DNA-T family DNA segregation ATPase FtsK/SpoIIIE
MAKKEKKENKSKSGAPVADRLGGIFSNLKEETLHAIIAIGFFVLAIFLIMAWLGSRNILNAGPAGDLSYRGLTFLFGYGFFLLPLLLFILSFTFFRSIKTNIGTLSTVGSFLFLASGLGLIDIIWANKNGGIVGEIVSYPFLKLFDFYASLIFLSAIFIVSLLIIFDARPRLEHFMFWRWFSKETTTEEEVTVISSETPEEESKKEEAPQEDNGGKIGASVAEMLGLGKKPPLEEESSLFIEQKKRTIRDIDDTYSPPPLSIFEKDKGKPGVGDIKANANIIKRTLQNFGINVEMDEISIGPTVTRYALKPAEGVKLSRIVGLQNDLALALAAHPLRIEAPIPGKSLVGIEIPNTVKATVGMATLFTDEKYEKNQKPLLLALGRGVSGQSRFTDLAKMPHMLIAGTTGSGKSVTIHTFINSLLFRNSPNDLKFIMIDPKRVELTLYNKIPHLLTPVITDAKKAILALKWAAKEMDRRYDILESETVRDIDSYHQNIVFPAYKKEREKGKIEDRDFAELPEKMPYIVIIIDELADIMTTYPRELEAGIVRLAQMSRAVGIHLIVSTQRPSVNVITGLIKANIPARVALQVSSQIDSRTILDTSGAEKLLGAGDMLFLSGEMSKPERMQSAFISEVEVKKVVKYLSDQYKDSVPSEIELTNGAPTASPTIFDMSLESSGDLDDDDDMYEEARQCVLEAGKASTSYLQRKLKVGYARAARLMDMLEERGVVSAGDGAKPREVLEKSAQTIATAGGAIAPLLTSEEDDSF